MDAKARQDCIKEIDLLKVNTTLFDIIYFDSKVNVWNEFRIFYVCSN